MKENCTVGSPFLEVFPSDGISKVMEDVNLHILIHSKIPVNFTSKFWEILEATSYYKKYATCRVLGMPLVVIFPCETCEPAHNNRCTPHLKGLGAHDLEFVEMKRLMIN